VSAALPTIVGAALLHSCGPATEHGLWALGPYLAVDAVPCAHATERARSCLLTRLLRAQEGLPGGGESDSVQSQVQRLIMQAESYENLCQSYIGWCPFW